MLTFLISIVVIILVVLALVGFHEYGHFLAARRLGIRVVRFSIGFGKVIWRKTGRKGTEYALCLFPLGGYVKMLDEREGPVAPELVHESFTAKPIWCRSLVVLAGPLANFIFALFAFWAMSMLGYLSLQPIVKSIYPNTPAAISQIKAGDKIVQVDNWPASDWMEAMIPMILRIGDQGEMKIMVEQPEQKRQTYLLPLETWKLDPLKPDLLKSLGLEPDIPEDKTKLPFYINQKGVWGSAKQAVVFSYQFSVLNLAVIYKMFTGKLSLKSLAGPITLFRGAILSFQQGLAVFLGFLAIVSVSIGLINLLPIPGLDGSHLLYLLIEKIRKQPVSLAMQVLLFRLGIIFLSVIFINVIMYDLLRWYFS